MRLRRLHHRLVAAALVALALMSMAVALLGMSIHEAAERTVWTTLLETELDRALSQPAGSATPLPAALRLYDGARAPLPQALQGVRPGLHDDLDIGGRESVALLRQVGARRVAMVMDITEFEHTEARMALGIAGSAFALGVLAALALATWIRRLLRPLDALAGQIAELPRDGATALVPLAGATQEVAVLAEALNGFLQRQREELARERAFLHSASHELRTPVAVIAGAAELAQAPDAPAAMRHAALRRIQATATRMTQLLEMLLVLARSPARVAARAVDVDLSAVVREVVDDHRALLAGRDLQLSVDAATRVPVVVPVELARVAIANLLRNAIEHSGAGVVAVRTRAPATLEIDDPGQGLPPARVAALYADAVRGEGGDAGGIGLPMLARLCAHLGWTLDIHASPDGGTRVHLVLGPAQ